MGTFRRVKEADIGNLGLYLYGDQARAKKVYLYEQSSPHTYMMTCDACGATIVCKLEELDSFLREIEDMECPDCGASALNYFHIDTRIKDVIDKLKGNTMLQDILNKCQPQKNAEDKHTVFKFKCKKCGDYHYSLDTEFWNKMLKDALAGTLKCEKCGTDNYQDFTVEEC